MVAHEDVFDVDAIVRDLWWQMRRFVSRVYNAYCELWYRFLDVLPEVYTRERTVYADERFGFVTKGNAVFPVYKRGGAWVEGADAVVAPRGEDPDPNRPQFFFDVHGVRALGTVVIERGVLLIYESHTPTREKHIGGVLVQYDSVKDTWKQKWRSEVPLATISIPLTAEPEAVICDGSWCTLSWCTESERYTYTMHHPFYDLEESDTVLERSRNNPIITPQGGRAWEAVATFNPAAVLIGDTVHMLYRAFGHDGRSVVGHATSKDGVTFLRSTVPAFVAKTKHEGVGVPTEEKNTMYRSPAHYGVDGAEDPRATCIDGRVYMLYAAFNGWQQARTAGTSIIESDLVCGNYDAWDTPVLLTSPPTRWGTGGKNGALFPKKIHGKYAIMYRTWPNIHIDYTDTPQFGTYKTGARWLEPKATIGIRPAFWDSGKIAVGPPPIEIDEGWLVLYVGVSQQAHDGYKVGAMILDKDNPEKVLYRTTRPVLSPKEWYEREGLVANITYPCGAVVKDAVLYVYYGGADTYVAVATAPLRDFVEAVKRDSTPVHMVIHTRISA